MAHATCSPTCSRDSHGIRWLVVSDWDGVIMSGMFPRIAVPKPSMRDRHVDGPRKECVSSIPLRMFVPATFPFTDRRCVHPDSACELRACFFRRASIVAPSWPPNRHRSGASVEHLPSRAGWRFAMAAYCSIMTNCLGCRCLPKSHVLGRGECADNIGKQVGGMGISLAGR